MDGSRFDRLTRTLGTFAGRRALLGRATVLLSAPALAIPLDSARREEAFARKKKRKRKKKKPGQDNGGQFLCTGDGSPCARQGENCQAENCLQAPFFIEARWDNLDSDHDTFLFVPSEAGNTDPAPYIDFSCSPANSNCVNDEYPFICVSHDAAGPGDEVTTIKRLLAGTYEYWIELDTESPAGDLTVLLRNSNLALLGSWSSPANPDSNVQVGWHVFDIDGATRGITSVDELIEGSLPEGAHNPRTDVCP